MNGCNENAIEFMTNGTKATLTFSQGRYKSVIRKLAEKHPEECQIIADNEDGTNLAEPIRESEASFRNNLKRSKERKKLCEPEKQLMQTMDLKRGRTDN